MPVGLTVLVEWKSKGLLNKKSKPPVTANHSLPFKTEMDE